MATTMSSLFVAFFALTASTFRTRAALQAEILALRHQLAVFQKNGPRRLRLHRCDRLLWVLLYRFWSGWRRCLAMVQPDTVIRWHRKAFAWHWTRKSRRLPGRPKVAANIRDLIRRMSQANPLVPVPRDITAVHTRRSISTRRALYVEKHEYPASPTTPLPHVLVPKSDSLVPFARRVCGCSQEVAADQLATSISKTT